MDMMGGWSLDVGIRDLLEAGLHFGHQSKRWNPRMKRYIFDKRNGIHVIDLAKSLAHLKESCKFVHDTVVGGRKILFVGTKRQIKEAVEEKAIETGQFYVTNRWLGGTLTNANTVRQSVRRMKDLEQQERDGVFDSLAKKEVSRLQNELAKLRRNLSGIADMDHLPGALFVVDINRESIAVAEANKLKIPVVAMVDTNVNPELVDYPIPGNDDAIRAVKLVLASIGEAIKKGVGEYETIAAEEARKRKEERDAAAAKAPSEPSTESKPRVRRQRKEPSTATKPAAGNDAAAEGSVAGETAGVGEPSASGKIAKDEEKSATKEETKPDDAGSDEAPKTTSVENG